MTKTPLLICAYRSRYLDVVLNWLTLGGIERKYRVFIWDNGGAKQIAAEYGFETYSLRSSPTPEVENVGKAFAMQCLVDIANKALPDAACYVCMDDDVIVDCDHLDALVSAAERPSIGMVAARFHPFNSVMPAGGSVVGLGPCTAFPEGLKLRTYPVEDRTVRDLGRVAGTLFAISKASVAKLRSAPYLYPILTRQQDNKPIPYWSEDATLDVALTKQGLTNGYLEVPGLTPAIHLPELDQDYMQWKLRARVEPSLEAFEFKTPPPQ